MSLSYQRYCLHELIGEGRQVGFDTPYYKAIILCFELTVQLLMESVGVSCRQSDPSRIWR